MVCDGGLGMLVSSAVPRLRCPEEANIRAPESVVSIHLGYIRAGADLAAIGANHGAGPQAALTALEQMHGNGLPLAALPNLGLASLAGGRIIYPHATPEYFAEFTAQARSLGAKLIGGCCGTTPVE